MHQSISKSKIYFYLFLLILLSTTINKYFINNFAEFFKVKKITIYGTTDQQKQIINEKLKFIINQNIFKVDYKLIEKNLDRLNFYNNLNLKKKYPSDIKLNFTQTDLLGIFYQEGEKKFVGGNNKAISNDYVNSPQKLPVIFGKFEIKEYLNLIKILEKNNIKLSSIQNFYYHNSGRWDIKIIDAEYIMLSSQNLVSSIKKYKLFIKNKSLKKIKSIDLRVENQISVIYE